MEPSIDGDFAARELTGTDFDFLQAGLALACVASVSNRVICFFFFCSCPSFLDEPREETLATQARLALSGLSRVRLPLLTGVLAVDITAALKGLTTVL